MCFKNIDMFATMPIFMTQNVVYSPHEKCKLVNIKDVGDSRVVLHPSSKKQVLGNMSKFPAKPIREIMI